MEDNDGGKAVKALYLECFASQGYSVVSLDMEGVGLSHTDIDQWKDEIPSAEFHAIPEVGHMPMEENPDLFNNVVCSLSLSPMRITFRGHNT